MIEKIVNYIEKSSDFIQAKILIFMQYILTIIQNNVSGFFQFLFERNIIITAIGIVVSTQISRLMTAFMSIFIDPIIKRISAGTVDHLKDLEVSVYDVNFKIGLFLDTLLNFSVTFYVVYQLYSLSKSQDSTGITNWLRNAKTQLKEVAQDKSNVVISVKSS
jgi:large-conductance mechanosensitive channel